MVEHRDTENMPLIGRMQACYQQIMIYVGGINLTFLFGNAWKNIWHATCWTDDFETINKPKPSCRFHMWCPCCRFHGRYKRFFFWLEGFRRKASSKSIVTSNSAVLECRWEWIFCAKHGFLFKQQGCDMAFIEPMHRNKPNITYFSSGN